MGLTIRWDITNRCNMHCIHCASYDSEVTNVAELTLSQVINIINELEEEQIDCIKFLGGEPLLRRDLHLIVKTLYEKKIPVGITTNGMTPISDEMWNCIENNMIKYVTISLDSNIDEINNTLRYGSNIQVIDNLVEQLVKTRNQLGLDLKLAINCVLNKRNYQYVDGLIQYAKQKKIDKVALMCLAPRGRAKALKDLICSPQDLLDTSILIAKQQDLDKNDSLIIEPTYAPALMVDYIGKKYDLEFPCAEYTCRATTSLGYIDGEGKLFPCETIANRYTLLRNDLKCQSFRTIWNSEAFDNIYANIELADTFPVQCRKCKYKKRLCYPCPGWSIKPKICQKILEEYPGLNL